MTSSGHETDGQRRVSQRRALLLAGTGAAGLLAGAGVTEAVNLSTGQDRATAPVSEIPPSEDLMREHGVLKRVLLVYREAAGRLTDGRDLPAASLHEAARVVHGFGRNRR